MVDVEAAVYVEKGGVGKTTSAGHLGRALAENGLDVLLIDLAGRQNDLAMQFGLDDAIEDVDAPISAIFRDDWDFLRSEIDDVVDRMVYDTGYGPDLIPSDAGLEGQDNNLANVPLEDRFTKLKSFVSEDLDGYDATLYDLPGKESNIALNGLVAAENVIAPVKPGEFERQQLDKLPAILAEIGEDTPVTPRLRMVIPTAVESQKNIHQDFLEYVNTEYPSLVAPAHIPNSANVEAAPTAGRTVFDVSDDELYATGKRARDAYKTNADELLNRLA